MADATDDPMAAVSVFTCVALRKLAAGWRLAAWAWAKGTQFDITNQDTRVPAAEDVIKQIADSIKVA